MYTGILHLYRYNTHIYIDSTIDSTIETPEAFQSIAAGYGHDHCLGRCTAVERSSTIAAGGRRTVFFLAEEARFLVEKWVISHHINPIISHEYTINIYCSIHSYNGLYPLVN